jgi:hypothetical protein
MEKYNHMKCKTCGRTLAIIAHDDDDTIVCSHCYAVVSAAELKWKDDGRYHFMAVGSVRDKKIADRVLLRDFTTQILDVKKALNAVRKVIMKEPNLRATCGEFEIRPHDIYIVPLAEKIQ